MTERKDLWWVIPVSIAVAGLILVSGFGNYLYGVSSGGLIIGLASISFDVFKIAALVGVFTMWTKNYKWQAGALCILFVGTTIWSMFSSVGFISTNFATIQDSRGKTASSWSALTSQIDQLQDRRNQVGSPRPQKTVQAEIDAILRIPGVNGCEKIDGPITQKHCPKFGELKAELGNAEAAIWLDGRLDKLRGELGKTEMITIVDPRTDSITAISGISAVSVVLFIKIFFALLIESATAFGLWAVWSPMFGRRASLAAKEGISGPAQADDKSPAPEAPTPAVKSLATDTDYPPIKPEPKPTPPKPDGGSKKLPEPVRISQELLDSGAVVELRTEPKDIKKELSQDPETIVKEWMIDCTRKAPKTSKPTIRKSYENFEGWCEEKKLEPLDIRILSKHMADILGMPKSKKGKRNSGGRYFPGIRLIEARPQQLKRAATG